MDPQTLGPYREAGGQGPYLAPPETWEGRLEEISKRPLAETRSLEEAIGLGLQVSHAQGWKH